METEKTQEPDRVGGVRGDARRRAAALLLRWGMALDPALGQNVRDRVVPTQSGCAPWVSNPELGDQEGLHNRPPGPRKSVEQARVRPVVCSRPPSPASWLEFIGWIVGCWRGGCSPGFRPHADGPQGALPHVDGSAPPGFRTQNLRIKRPWTTVGGRYLSPLSRPSSAGRVLWSGPVGRVRPSSLDGSLDARAAVSLLGVVRNGLLSAGGSRGGVLPSRWRRRSCSASRPSTAASPNKIESVPPLVIRSARELRRAAE
jgi:hypothetical protein